MASSSCDSCSSWSPSGLGFQLIQLRGAGHRAVLSPWLAFGGTVLLSLGVIVADMPRSAASDSTPSRPCTWACIVGLFLTYVLRLAFSSVLPEQVAGDRLATLGAGHGAVLHLHQPAAADQGRFSLHHSLRRVRQGSQGPQALRARHQRGHRRADRRRGRDQDSRQSTDHAAVRHRRAAGRGRQLPTVCAAAAAAAGSTFSIA